jgi:alpha-glucosidase
MYLRSGGTDPGRDGCRVPLPWAGATAPFGFSPAGATAEPWLPQPDNWAALTVEAERLDPASMLNLYRTILALRRDDPCLGGGDLRWLPSPEQVLAFARGPRFICVVNLSSAPIALPADCTLLLASAELADGRLPSDAAAWLRPEGASNQDRTLRGSKEGGE